LLNVHRLGHMLISSDSDSCDNSFSVVWSSSQHSNLSHSSYWYLSSSEWLDLSQDTLLHVSANTFLSLRIKVDTFLELSVFHLEKRSLFDVSWSLCCCLVAW
jgi:hypothetical protein